MTRGAGAARQRFLIVTADDFGLHPAVNEAVEAANRVGTLSATSLMVAAPAAADAVRRAHGLADLHVGLHLTLADGAALLPRRLIPDLVDAQGRFGSNMAADGVKFFFRPAVRRQLAAEIRAQFEAFARTGLALDHLNAHKHFHLHPTLLAMALAIGRDFGLQAVRLPAEPARHPALPPRGLAGTVADACLRPWIGLMRRRLKAAGLACNDQVFGISHSGRMTEERLLAVLTALPAGVTEIYLHPGTRSGEAITASMTGYRHEDELAGLLSPRVRHAVAHCGAPLGGFSDLARTAAA